MEASSNWRPPQGDAGSAGSGAEEPSNEWRSQLQPEARNRIVNKIMDILKRHLPISGPDGIAELKKIAIRFEEKIYSAATSQLDYLRKISMKMLTVELKTQGNVPSNQLASNTILAGQNSAEAANTIQSQVRIQVQSMPVPMATMSNQSHQRQQLLSQSLQNNIQSASVHGSAGLPSALPSMTGVAQSGISNLGQSSNVQGTSGISQNSINSYVGQSLPSNIYSNSQRQVQGRHPQQSIMSQQHQQASQNQLHYQQQQILKEKMQQQSSILQSQIPQQQHNLLQPNQLHSAQQPITQMSSGLQSNQSALQHSQPPIIQSVPQSSLQQSQQTAVQQPAHLHQNAQQVVRQQQQLPQQSNLLQQSSLLQQPTSITQQPSVLSSQQQQILGNQSTMTNVQQNHLIGHQNNVSEIQMQHHQQQQHQRLPNQQSNIMSMQQSHQIMNQQNVPLHQQQMALQNMSGLQQQQQTQQQQTQQQQLLPSQSSLSGMQQHQHPLHALQHSKAAGQQAQKSATSIMQLQAQKTQSQSSQQQHLSQLQQQTPHLQHQIGMQQQFQQRLQASGTLLQSQNAVDQQKQSLQTQRLPLEASTTSVDSTSQGGQTGLDWQEEIYQKLKSMKELYYHELNDLHQKISLKFQQHEALTLPPKQSEQLESLKKFKAMLEKYMHVLQLPKSSIVPVFKERLPHYEKHIISLLNTHRTKRVPPLQTQGPQQFQHSSGLNSSLPQAPSQISQLQQPDSHINQMQHLNGQASITPIQSATISTMQSGSISLSTPLGGVPTTQQSIMSSLQPCSNVDSLQVNNMSSTQLGGMSSLHTGGLGMLQQTTINASHPNNITTLASNNVNATQSTSSLQANTNTLQHQVKQEQQQQQQQQQQQLMQAHQIKQHLQQRQFQQQLIQQQQKQHMLQQQPQLHQSQKQQHSTQMQGHQIPQLHQMSEMNDSKMRQVASIKSGLLQPHYTPGQRQAYFQSVKVGSSFPISSQNLQVPSPQISQHSSPQIDQQPLPSSLNKAGTPLQSANSPFVVPSPSTPLVPSPLQADHEKAHSAVSSLSNVGNIGQQQAFHISAQHPSLAVGTPGISASPLLAEFAVDGNQANMSALFSGKATSVEKPLDRLIKAVRSSSPTVLSSFVSDVSSVVSMIDRIAGSAPGNGSRAAVGEDLVAMTKCRMQARNFISQDGTAATKKMKRHTNAMPLNVTPSAGSANDSIKQSNFSTSELESTATSRVKKHKSEVNYALVEEVRAINLQLIDTIVDFIDEDTDSVSATVDSEGGTVVKCTYSAVALSPNLKSQFASAKVSPILPLRLLIPASYPFCSPVLLDKIPVEPSKEFEDLSVKAKSRFNISLRGISQPMTLKEMARTWDVCARKVISEYAEQCGGGSFSSRYGTWENCANA